MKPRSKSKDQVRVKRQRNLVAKNNKHKGGYHTPKGYRRLPDSDWLLEQDILMESGRWNTF